MRKKKKKKGSVIKRALLFIGGVLLIVCIALNVTGVAGNKTSSPFDDSARKGFVTIGVDKGIMKVPSTFDDSTALTEIDETTKNNEAYKYVKENGKLFFNFEKYAVSFQCMEIKDLSDMKYNLGEFERQAMIRIDQDHMERVASEKKDSVAKEIYSCNAEVLLDEGLYGDFTGYFSIMQSHRKCYFLFAGLPKDEKATTSEQDAIKYMVYSGNVQSTSESVNPITKIEGSDGINYAEQYNILSEPVVDSGFYGYFTVINKSEKPEEIQIAGTVDEFQEGDAAEKIIRNYIGKTVYKELPEAENNNRWILATIEYQTLGYDMTAVPPAIPVKIRDDQGAFVDSMVYTLKTDYPNNKIQIFYELPNNIKNYRVCIGLDSGYLSVRNTTEASEEQNQKEE